MGQDNQNMNESQNQNQGPTNSMFVPQNGNQPPQNNNQQPATKKNFVFNLVRLGEEGDIRIAFMSISGYKNSSKIIYEKLEEAQDPTALFMKWLQEGKLKLEKARTLSYNDSDF